MRTRSNTSPSGAGHRALRVRKLVWRDPAAAAVGVLLWAASHFALSSSVEAQCSEGWDIGGTWGLKQSNQAVPNSMVLGHAFTGKGEIRGDATYRNERGNYIKGAVQGTAVGDNVHLEISWDNGWTGIYDGKIGPRGKIEGTGYERRSPSKKVSWYSDRVMVCPSPAPAPTPDPMGPGKFVIVHCLGNLIQVPKYRPPIADDVVLGDKYQVKGIRGGNVIIRTPQGTHNKEYQVPRSCVEVSPK